MVVRHGDAGGDAAAPQDAGLVEARIVHAVAPDGDVADRPVPVHGADPDPGQVGPGDRVVLDEHVVAAPERDAVRSGPLDVVGTHGHLRRLLGVPPITAPYSDGVVAGVREAAVFDDRPLAADEMDAVDAHVVHVDVAEREVGAAVDVDGYSGAVGDLEVVRLEAVQVAEVDVHLGAGAIARVREVGGDREVRDGRVDAAAKAGIAMEAEPHEWVVDVVE